MAHLPVIVPKEHVDALRRELLRAHAERAAALRRALDCYLESHDHLDDVEGALVELADLHAAIVQLGWKLTTPPRDVRLTVHPEVLADATAAVPGLAGAGE
jgi:hypothetical protein